MSDPAFLFYSNDFLGGVSDLTMEERGQYITLLCLQHQKGCLTRKIIDINVPNISPDVLSKFFEDKNGCFYQKRLAKEIKRRAEYSKKQSDRAKKRWNATASATAMPQRENENVNENRNNKGGSRGMKIPTVEECFDYLAERYCDVTTHENLKTLSESFWNFYDSKGWMVGKNKMQKWKSALSNWANNNLKKQQTNEQQFDQAFSEASTILKNSQGI